MSTLQAVYSAIGGHHLTAPRLLWALQQWGEEPRVEICDRDTARGAPAHLCIDGLIDETSGAFVILREPRTPDASTILRRASYALARILDTSIDLIISGDTGGGALSSTFVGHEAWTVTPRGVHKPWISDAAAAYARRVNPVPDDCPYEEFHELLTTALQDAPTRHTAPPSLADLPTDGVLPECIALYGRTTRDLPPRVRAILDRIDMGATHEITSREDADGVIVHLIEADGRQISYLNASEAAALRQALSES